MKKYLDRLSDAKAMEFILQFEKYFKDMPHLPKEVKEMLVGAAPYFAIVAAILNGLGAIGNLNGVLAYSRWMGVPGQGVPKLYLLALALLQMASAVILYYAYEPLKTKKLLAWVYMFWILVLGVLATFTGIIFGMSSLVWTVIGTILGLYFLFELKPFYSKSGEKAKDLDPDNPNSK